MFHIWYLGHCQLSAYDCIIHERVPSHENCKSAGRSNHLVRMFTLIVVVIELITVKVKGLKYIKQLIPNKLKTKAIFASLLIDVR